MHVRPWWPCSAAAGLAINYFSSGLARIPVIAIVLAGCIIQPEDSVQSYCTSTATLENRQSLNLSSASPAPSVRLVQAY